MPLRHAEEQVEIVREHLLTADPIDLDFLELHLDAALQSIRTQKSILQAADAETVRWMWEKYGERAPLKESTKVIFRGTPGSG